MTAIEALIYVLVFYAGGMVGFVLKAWLNSRRSYSGTIYVSTEDHKTLYSLELEDYPESIAFRKEVVFKVDASKIEDLDRG